MTRPIYLHGSARRASAIAGLAILATGASTSTDASRSGRGTPNDLERAGSGRCALVCNQAAANDAAREVASGNRHGTGAAPKSHDRLPHGAGEGRASRQRNKGAIGKRTNSPSVGLATKGADTLTRDAIRDAWHAVRRATSLRTGPEDRRSLVYLRFVAGWWVNFRVGINVVRPWNDRLTNSENHRYAGIYTPDVAFEDFEADLRSCYEDARRALACGDSDAVRPGA